jgi:signal transduction histidine kinase
MKLWQKTAIICISVLLIIVFACSAVLLVHAKNSILELTYSHAEDKQRGLASSFSEMASYYLTEEDSATVEASLVNYCFSRFADFSSVLMRGEETLYSGVSVDPRTLLPLSGNEYGIQLTEREIEGRNVLIVGSLVTVKSTPYAVYVVEDISTTYNSITNMAGTFVIVSMAGILLGAGSIALLMRRSTRPLTALALTARRIADGEYGIRASVETHDEVGTLADDFNMMAKAMETRIAELTETAERQRLFIGGVTHEFKTPLTALLLHTRMLRRANMTEEEKNGSLAHIESQCEWLERLVQTLLRIITLDREIERKPCAVDVLFDRVRQNTQKSLADRGVTLNTLSDGGTLLVNADLIQSLLINLVDNAAKAYDTGMENRKVCLTVSGSTIEVSDNGRGIPKEALPRIFEPFYMVDKSRSKKSGGSGLGLTLVRKIADAHGAEITVESSVGKGTTVRLRFQ